MYKSILVPVDLSHPEPGRKTLKIAQTIAGADGRIALLTVLPEIPPFAASELPEGMLNRNLANARKELEAFGKIVLGEPLLEEERHHPLEGELRLGP